MLPFLRLVMKRWFRSEVRDIERVPAEGGVLIVSNHSGGLMPMDVPIIAVAFHDEFGTERPLYTLAHDMLFTGAIETTMRRAGFVEATPRERRRGARARRGDDRLPRRRLRQLPARRCSRTSSTSPAAPATSAPRSQAGVPIVPVVSIGGQEQQLFLWRGEILAKWLRLEQFMRTDYMPVGLGFPFGLTFAFPPNLPLPTKIVTQVLEPIDIVAEFGEEPEQLRVRGARRRGDPPADAGRPRRAGRGSAGSRSSG